MCKFEPQTSAHAEYFLEPVYDKFMSIKQESVTVESIRNCFAYFQQEQLGRKGGTPQTSNRSNPSRHSSFEPITGKTPNDPSDEIRVNLDKSKFANANNSCNLVTTPTPHEDKHFYHMVYMPAKQVRLPKVKGCSSDGTRLTVTTISMSPQKMLGVWVIIAIRGEIKLMRGTT